MINTSNLIYTWRVEMKERREYKIEKKTQIEGDRRIKRKTL